MRFEHVLVVGAGQMGGGIAQVVAASGRRVSLHDELPGAAEKALSAMEKSLGKLAEKGGPAPAEVLSRVTAVDDLVPAELLIEAVVEDAAVKEAIFRRADETLPAMRFSPRTRPRSRSHRLPQSQAVRTRSSACTSSTRCPS